MSSIFGAPMTHRKDLRVLFSEIVRHVVIQGLVHLNLTSMGFCCITDLLLPRANNLILFMNIQPARNPLGKFVEH